jgi:hypothetical protein
LKHADFFSSPTPRLTIELPQRIDEPTRRFLETYQWPPAKPDGRLHVNLMTLRHRIPQQGLTAEENSIRMLESFWPAMPSNSHILILSPQVELSPLFYHYLKYTLLEYYYSASPAVDTKRLLSISLDLPQSYLNDSTPFTPPAAFALTETDSYPRSTPFLWQAPNSNAALYFGGRWTELHSLVSSSMESSRILPTPTTLAQKLVAKTYPAWLEHILTLARARGYVTLYPSFPGTDSSLAIVHNDLYQPPQEFSADAEITARHLDPDNVDSIEELSDLTADPRTHLSLHHKEQPLITTNLLNVIGDEEMLPSWRDLPVLAWDGEQMDIDELGVDSMRFKDIFRHEVGGCKIDAPGKPTVEGTATDLFCLHDVEEIPAVAEVSATAEEPIKASGAEVKVAPAVREPLAKVDGETREVKVLY